MGRSDEGLPTIPGVPHEGPQTLEDELAEKVEEFATVVKATADDLAAKIKEVKPRQGTPLANAGDALRDVSEKALETEACLK